MSLTRPPWNPPWDDVAFDHASARRAVEMCRRTASAVVEAAHHTATEAESARQGWTGRFRDEFDDSSLALNDHRDALAERLLLFAAQTEAAAEEATTEQRRREDLRMEWHVECRRLEERARSVSQ